MSRKLTEPLCSWQFFREGDKKNQFVLCPVGHVPDNLINYLAIEASIDTFSDYDDLLGKIFDLHNKGHMDLVRVSELTAQAHDYVDKSDAEEQDDCEDEESVVSTVEFKDGEITTSITKIKDELGDMRISAKYKHKYYKQSVFLLQSVKEDNDKFTFVLLSFDELNTLFHKDIVIHRGQTLPYQGEKYMVVDEYRSFDKLEEDLDKFGDYMTFWNRVDVFSTAIALLKAEEAEEEKTDTTETDNGAEEVDFDTDWEYLADELADEALDDRAIRQELQELYKQSTEYDVTEMLEYYGFILNYLRSMAKQGFSRVTLHEDKLDGHNAQLSFQYIKDNPIILTYLYDEGLVEDEVRDDKSELTQVTLGWAK